MSDKRVYSDNPRVLAVQTLAKIKNGAYSNLQLNQIIKQHKLGEADTRLLTTLVYGVIQHRLTFEYWLEPFIGSKKINPWVRELLYTAVFQMQYLDKIPQHAIFNESIEVAKILGHVGIGKFVTAILHNISRQGLRDVADIKDDVERLSIEYSLPVWLVEELIKQNGDKHARQIITSINDAPKQSVRVNTVITTDEEVVQALEAENFIVESSKVAAHAFVVSGGHVASSKAYHDGWLTLQDESAMLPVESLHLTPDVKNILDAAAAPGGKTTQLAQYSAPDAIITALDVHEHKIKLINHNAERLHVADKIHARVLDARKVPEQIDKKFERILVDAPCSGFGLLRRKPEIRYDKTIEDVASLARLQAEILDSVSQNLAKNGIMVYSTCTILRQENDDVVTKFLKNHPNFELMPTKTSYKLKLDDSEKALHVYPSDYQTDGFFVATLRKND
ncbi:ribosomal RNA small subunit methyltransferase B [Leuconostoc litchii]|uniref:16S rRNA (cytosine(967)-C(5))-methyltransferase n=1 Tax=Leuconostoc litchii TaxID=1981069 RepID=A0A6P2CQF4_9LACO|nr:16S rRNA (cytosine(967)-C(5))-methyltransferase RsmB [Leuconostoc litchii]TYC46577.1 16S rRNA (cytosine(967)-C(5))-methyltransferase RsmB [Leuconostoc litchii]GMA70430.1 ribosomal RNA small subunit methyltransferase B [Leuconostoc litchii]